MYVTFVPMMHKMNVAKKAVNFVRRNIMLKQTMPLFETLSNTRWFVL